MDHHAIEENNIVERYVQGRLSGAERLQFEEHFVDCEECLDRMQAVEGLRAGLRASASRMTPAPARSGWPVWRTALAAAIFLGAIAIPSALYVRASNELVQTKLASADLEKKYVEERARAAADREAQLRSSELGSAPFSMFSLSLTRGGGPDMQIALPVAPGWIVLLLEREPNREYSHYRALLVDAQGKEVWRQENVRQELPEALAISFSSRLVHPGRYEVRVEGATAAGRFGPPSRYGFLVVGSK